MKLRPARSQIKTLNPELSQYHLIASIAGDPKDGSTGDEFGRAASHTPAFVDIVALVRSGDGAWINLPTINRRTSRE